MRRIFIMVAAACLIGSAAFAHAFLDSASPAVGSEVSDPPAAVALTFSEPVEPLFSTIQVTDTAGVRMDEGKPEMQEDGRVLRVALKPLAAGVFSVQWHVTSVDTHKTEGHFVFTVKP